MSLNESKCNFVLAQGMDALKNERRYLIVNDSENCSTIFDEFWKKVDKWFRLNARNMKHISKWKSMHSPIIIIFMGEAHNLPRGFALLSKNDEDETEYFLHWLHPVLPTKGGAFRELIILEDFAKERTKSLRLPKRYEQLKGTDMCKQLLLRVSSEQDMY